MKSRMKVVPARRAKIGKRVYVVELIPDGVSFREVGGTLTVIAALDRVLNLARSAARKELRRR